jgi:excisionase family DNA binding protein
MSDLTQKLLQAVLSANEEQKKIALLALSGQVRDSNGPKLLKPTDAAKYLGVARSTLWRLTKRGALTTIELMPGMRCFRRQDLDLLAEKGVQ